MQESKRQEAKIPTVHFSKQLWQVTYSNKRRRPILTILARPAESALFCLHKNTPLPAFPQTAGSLQVI